MLSGMTVPVSELEPPTTPSAAPRLLGVLAVVLLAAAIVSAVVVQGNDRSPQERFVAIQGAVAEEPFAFEMTFAGDGIELSMTGFVDPATTRTKAEMDMSSMLPEGAGVPPKISMISEGTTAYLLVPVAPGAPPQWAKIDAATLTKGATGGLPSGTNPLDSFEQLRAVDAEIEDLGEEDVRGTKTTHFRTTLDLTKALDAVPDPRAAAALAGMDAVPVDVWLDEDDRPRRQRMTFELPGGLGKMTLTIEAFDFGKPVDIELPPADQVVDGSGLLGS